MRVYILVAIGILGLGAIAWAQTATNPAPSAITCAYNTSPPTSPSGSFVFVQCNSSGQLVVQ